MESFQEREGVRVVNDGYWKSKENRKKAYSYAKKTLAIKAPEDWYQIRATDLKNIGLSGMIGRYYSDCWKKFPMEFNPDFEFVPWKFITAPIGYWKSKENRRKAYSYAKKILDIKVPEDWYQIRATDLTDIGLSAMIASQYRDCWKKFPMEFNPGFEFVPWKFITVPNGFWKERSNIRKYFEWLADIKGFTCMTNFYGLKTFDLASNFGSAIISQRPYRTIAELLKLAFPEYEWVEWKFARVTNGFWDSKANQRMYLLWLFKELKLKFPDEATELKMADFGNNYGSSLVYNQTITEVLQNAFETYDWISIMQKSQPRHEALVTYVSKLCAHPELKCSRVLHYLVKNKLSINCYIPELKLGFQLVKSLDQSDVIMDSVICQSEGIKLIQLPEELVITKKMIKKIMVTVSSQLDRPKNTQKMSSQNAPLLNNRAHL